MPWSVRLHGIWAGIPTSVVDSSAMLARESSAWCRRAPITRRGTSASGRDVCLGTEFARRLCTGYGVALPAAGIFS